MLLQYGFKNFLSFREGATVSLRLDGNVPESISLGRDYATIMCVKGANGSGKTHLLKGLAFVANFITRSFSEQPDAKIAISPFGLSQEPSSFFVEFRISEHTYVYELEASRDAVIREALYRTKKRKTKLFERIENNFVDLASSLSTLNSIKLRKNASVISTAQQHEVVELQEVFEAFNRYRFNVTHAGVYEQAFLDLNKACEYLSQSPEWLEWVTTFIRECDVGISSIKIQTQEGPDGKAIYFPVFYHTIDGVELAVHSPTESSGTKQLVRHLLIYASIINMGGVLILDEFDLYLHPAILPKLLNLFLSKENNPESAQLLFTTHQTSIVDLCGRYRTQLVNKEDNSSYTYRLDEIPGDILRNDRPISVPYDEGRIGGVPRI